MREFLWWVVERERERDAREGERFSASVETRGGKRKKRGEAAENEMSNA